MSDRKTVVRRAETAVSSAWLISADSLGINLGELRQLVTAAEGIPDKAYVKVGGVSSSFYEGRLWVKNMWIESEVLS